MTHREPLFPPQVQQDDPPRQEQVVDWDWADWIGDESDDEDEAS